MRFVNRSLIPLGLFLFIFTIEMLDKNKLTKARAEDKKTQVSYKNSNLSRDVKPKCEMQSDTKVFCPAATITEIQQFFELEMKDHTEAVELEVEICYNEVPEKDWSSVKTNIEKINLKKSKITNYTDLTFKGLKGLNELHIFNTEMYTSKNLLAPISKQIKKFEFFGVYNFNKNDPKNLFAENTLNFQYLDYIKISYNNFADFIQESTFKNIGKLKSLCLQNTKITSIHALAFSNNRELEMIDLNNNMLVNIPVDLFISPRISLIIVSFNRFKCDCNLKDFIDFYKKFKKEKFNTKVVCTLPEDLKFQEITKTKLQNCDSNENSTTMNPETLETTTSASPKPSTTEIPSNDYNIKCENNCKNCDNYLTSYRKIKKADVSFIVKTTSKTAVTVILNEMVNNMDILWFNRSTFVKNEIISTNNDSENGCKLDINKTIEISGLKENITYVFCLLKRNNTEISPFNCQPHHVKISNDDLYVCKINLIIHSLLIFGIAIPALVGAILMYYLIRYNPTLLKESPKVIIMKEYDKKVMMAPITMNRINDVKSTAQTEFGERFITQIANKSILSKVNHERRASDSSFMTSQSYFVPDLYEIAKYHKTLELDQARIYLEKLPYTLPPSVPEKTPNLSDKIEPIYAYPNKQNIYKF